MFAIKEPLLLAFDLRRQQDERNWQMIPGAAVPHRRTCVD